MIHIVSIMLIYMNKLLSDQKGEIKLRVLISLSSYKTNINHQAPVYSVCVLDTLKHTEKSYFTNLISLSQLYLHAMIQLTRGVS